jgi:hypothetical protein
VVIEIVLNGDQFSLAKPLIEGIPLIISFSVKTLFKLVKHLKCDWNGYGLTGLFQLLQVPLTRRPCKMYEPNFLFQYLLRESTDPFIKEKFRTCQLMPILKEIGHHESKIYLGFQLQL